MVILIELWGGLKAQWSLWILDIGVSLQGGASVNAREKLGQAGSCSRDKITLALGLATLPPSRKF